MEEEKGAVEDVNKIAEDILAEDAPEIEPEPEVKEPETTSVKKDAPIPDDKGKVLTTEERIAKISEILGDDPKAIEAYIKKFGYHKDPAWQKLLEKSKSAQPLDEETQRKLDEFKKITSTPEYIRMVMHQQGYKEEAIDAELTKRGFEITPKPYDVVALVTNKLGIKPESLDENTKAVVSDISKIVDILLENRLGKELPKRFQPFEAKMRTDEQRESAQNIMSEIEKLVTKEGVLDFKADLEPELNKWLDENTPKGVTQSDFQEAVKDIYHDLCIERLKTGGKRKETEVKKMGNRPNLKTGTPGKIPDKTGDRDADMDNLLDSLGVTE